MESASCIMKQVAESIFYNYTVVVVPDHDGGRRKKINAWFLNTHMVYL